MASSPGPSTPDHTPRRMPMISRSFTAPLKTSTPPRPLNAEAEIGATENIEVLYYHPNASVFAFGNSSISARLSSPGRPQSSSGTLPWTTPTERTIAVGPLEMYRVPGSASFLKSGSLLHPILPRSQCWCVDDVSKFVLPGRETYYRVELPAEDLEEVERFKATLKKILFYERTPCPFKRAFEVELPPEQLEVKKKRRKSSGPAKKWKLANGSKWRPDGWEQPEVEEDGNESASASASGSQAGSDDEAEESASGVEEDHSSDGRTPAESAEVTELEDDVKELRVSKPLRPRALDGMRSITAPPQLTLRSTPPSKLRTTVDLDGIIEVQERSDSQEAGASALRTFQAIPTDMPPSPPDSSAGLDWTGACRQNHEAAAEEPDAERDEEESAIEEDTSEAAALKTDAEMLDDDDPAADEDALDATSVHEVAHSSLDEADAARETGSDQADAEHENLEPVLRSAEDDIEGPQNLQDALITEAPQEQDGLAADRAIEIPSQPIATAEDSRESETFAEDQPSTPPSDHQSAVEDPYAAIQARILARRSIGGTASSHPLYRSPTRSSTSSSTSNKSAISRRSTRTTQQRQGVFASEMVRKACSIFLGPPAHLVAIMLKIASRFASGAFGVDGLFYVESPIDQRNVPGSYRLRAGYDGAEEASWAEEDEYEEDDFGVPLRSPARVAKDAGADGVRARTIRGRGWDVD